MHRVLVLKFGATEMFLAHVIIYIVKLLVLFKSTGLGLQDRQQFRTLIQTSVCLSEPKNCINIT